MTINYIRHDHEFLGVIKLVSGEEILGNLIVTEEEGQSVVYITNPAMPTMTPVEKEGTIGLAVSLVKWMMWSEEEFYMIQEPDIVTIAPMSTEAEMMYKLWVRKEMGDEVDDSQFQVNINKNMGLVGKVSEVRQRLEDLWNKST